MDWVYNFTHYLSYAARVLLTKKSLIGVFWKLLFIFFWISLPYSLYFYLASNMLVVFLTLEVALTKLLYLFSYYDLLIDISESLGVLLLLTLISLNYLFSLVLINNSASFRSSWNTPTHLSLFYQYKIFFSFYTLKSRFFVINK